jgi:hypothetical protein
MEGLRRRAGFMAAAGALAVLLMALPAAAGASAPTRYSVANGCWSLAPAAGGASLAPARNLRFKATGLGSYMLYTRAKSYLAANGGSVGEAGQPSPAGDWRVTGTSERGFSLSPHSAKDSVLTVTGGTLGVGAPDGASSRFRFVPAKRCAHYPEAPLDVSGKPAKGKTSYGEVRGVLDGHMHWMTYEYLGGDFHCGRPWSAYGITVALPDCSSIEGPQGSTAPVQNFLNYGTPVHPHDTSGYPQLTAWGPSNLTYEGTYYRWIQRDWKDGLRMIVMPVNENRVLCELMTKRRNSCDEMHTVYKGIRDIKNLQQYVDAQAGGPGKGFFQIVRNPFQARKVMNEGKMAVVLEVEVSELFDCQGAVKSSCNREVIQSGLQKMHRMGVRSSLLLNKFDNPLTGVRFDSGPVGVLINAANKSSYGSFWSAKTCTDPLQDNTIDTVVPPNAFLTTLLGQLGVAPGTLPVYPPAPHCNTRGLTKLGRFTVNQMMDRGMIVNPDHMSQKAVSSTLDIAEHRNYSGVISPHGWMDPGNWPRIWKLGGLAFPGAGASEQGFVDVWKHYRPKKTPYYFGWGYGADLGGLAHQGNPPPAGTALTIKYPFKSIDGATTVHKQRTGQRTFDFNTDGVAHYGLYADWLQAVTQDGGAKMKRDMLRGPEAYLQMWERAVGVPRTRCLGAHTPLTSRGLGRLRLGESYHHLLMRAGQPLRRTQAWTWCAGGKGNRHAADNAVLTPGGKVALVSSDAKGEQAGGIAIGDSAKVLAGGHATPLGGHYARLVRGNGTFLYEIRNGRIASIAVADPSVPDSSTLVRYLALARNSVQQRPSRVVGAAPGQVTVANAVPLAQHGGQIAMFCGL